MAGSVDVARMCSRNRRRATCTVRFRVREAEGSVLNKNLAVAPVYIEDMVLGYRPEICVWSVTFDARKSGPRPQYGFSTKPPSFAVELHTPSPGCQSCARRFFSTSTAH